MFLNGRVSSVWSCPMRSNNHRRPSRIGAECSCSEGWWSLRMLQLVVATDVLFEESILRGPHYGGGRRRKKTWNRSSAQRRYFPSTQELAVEPGIVSGPAASRYVRPEQERAVPILLLLPPEFLVCFFVVIKPPRQQDATACRRQDAPHSFIRQ